MSSAASANVEVVRLEPQPGPQTLFAKSTADIVIFGGSAGGGKMLCLSTPLPTPGGWTSMGAVRVGDELFDERGAVCRVERVYDVDPEPESYRLTFDDGSAIDACAEHLWRTMTNKERMQAFHLTDEFRATRRNKRKSRSVIGGRFDMRSIVVTERNRAKVWEYKDAPRGELRTTEEIAAAVKVCRGGRTNHSIRVAGALQLPERQLGLDPYLLGVWLGDGTTICGTITTADGEIVKAFEKAGFTIKQRSSAKYGYGVHGLQRVLRLVGVLGNKHIPPAYLRGSQAQRLALLQGLMDTDGYASKSGQVEFSNTNKTLALGLLELVHSLGWKATIRESDAKLNGRIVSKVYDIKWSPDEYVFRLKRKRDRQCGGVRRPTVRNRYVVSCMRITPKPMRCITVSSSSGMFLCGRSMVPTHNSFSLLLEPLRHVLGRFANPNFAAVTFRRTTPEIRNPGALWDESLKLYSSLGAKASGQNLEWVFPCGAKTKFWHLEYEKDVYAWHGAQIPLIQFDELTLFTKFQFFYMLSRNRSTCGVQPYIRATCNPDSDSWVAEFISWWINQDTGFPIPERAGKLRWFMRVGDELKWSSRKADLQPERLGLPRFHPDGKEIEYLPKSVTFIPATVFDNQILMRTNPEYLANLLAQPTVERERLLKGNWKIKAAAGLHFRREWVGELVEVLPPNLLFKRGYDLAATAKTDMNDPDFTTSTKIGLDQDTGTYYVVDHQWAQESAASVEGRLLRNAKLDGKLVEIRLPRDPAAAGKTAELHFTRLLTGYNVRFTPQTPNEGNKVVRFNPFSAQTQGGNVRVLKAPWNERWFGQLEGFPDLAHDDDADSTSIAFNAFEASTTGMLDVLRKQAYDLRRKEESLRNPQPVTKASGGVLMTGPEGVNLLYGLRGEPIFADENHMFLLDPKQADLLSKNPRSGFRRVVP